jgi:hypothetical protein
VLVVLPCSTWIAAANAMLNVAPISRQAKSMMDYQKR